MKSNSGTVLIYIVTAGAILASVLVLLQTGNRIFIQRVDALMRETEARYAAYGPILLTRHLLMDDLQKNATDGPGDNWYRFNTPRKFPVENGEIHIRLSDANRVPDINQLFTGTTKDPFYKSALKKYLAPFNVSGGFVNNLKDWVDPDPRPSGGSEFSAISGKPARNKPMISADELSLLSGHTAAITQHLSGKVNYLPKAAPINVNTANLLFLQSLFNSSTNSLDRIISQRERQPFHAIGDFYEAARIKTPTKAVELGVHSTYFTTDVDITLSGTRKKVEALFERREGKTHLRRLLWD